MTATRKLISATLTIATIALALVFQAPTAQAGTSPQVEINFTKWITSFPDMAGVVSGDVAGDFTGVVLNAEMIAGGKIAQLEALYGILAGDHSFLAHIKGTETLQTQHAVLNGRIVEGWLAGAQVHVEFEVIACEEHGACFQGTIRIMPSNTD